MPILLPPKPPTYAHAGLLEIDNKSMSLRLLIDERSMEDDSIVSERIDACTLSYEDAAKDPGTADLSQRIYNDLRALSLIMLDRWLNPPAQPAEQEVEDV